MGRSPTLWLTESPRLAWWCTAPLWSPAQCSFIGTILLQRQTGPLCQWHCCSSSRYELTCQRKWFYTIVCRQKKTINVALTCEITFIWWPFFSLPLCWRQLGSGLIFLLSSQVFRNSAGCVSIEKQCHGPWIWPLSLIWRSESPKILSGLWGLGIKCEGKINEKCKI